MKLRIKVDMQTFEVEVGDINDRPILVSVDGDTIEVWPEEAQPSVPVRTEASPAVSRPGPAVAPPPPEAAVGDRTKIITAPIPGLILSISVKSGDQVAFGQELCVLEAMKMKNLIRANRAGIVGSINVAPGDQVRHSQVLMEFTD